jgi:23S rRNA G2445 N2-methylase RlmL
VVALTIATPFAHNDAAAKSDAGCGYAMGYKKNRFQPENSVLLGSRGLFALTLLFSLQPAKQESVSSRTAGNHLFYFPLTEAGSSRTPSTALDKHAKSGTGIRMRSFHDIQKNATILITCPRGLSDFLKNEVKSLGYPPTGHFPTGVTVKGSLIDCMTLNLGLSTAHHVLLLLKEFFCNHPDLLYREVNSIDWEYIVPSEGYVCVTSVVHTDTITDTRFANLKCKDAIVDRMAQKNGKRCNSGSRRDNTVVHLYWQDDRCMLYIDTSGQPLSKRGYRLNPGSAPMQETLAAAVVRATGWNGKGTFINPMCGSGTLAIEAALVGLNRAPGTLRDNFGFMHLAPFDREAYSNLLHKFISRENKVFPGKIIATDRDQVALDAASANAKKAGVDAIIDFDTCDFDATEILDGKGVVVINPEYGFRMGNPEELKKVYKRIGDFFKRRCNGYTGFVFTGNFDLAKYIGLKSKWKTAFLSGKIECRLYAYELYAINRINTEHD